MLRDLETYQPVKIPVYSSYPPIDPAQCIDYGDIFEFCVVGENCKSSIQLYTEAKDPTCWTDQSTGKLMVLPSQRYAEIVNRPDCRGIFYPFSKSTADGDSYVTVLADSNKVNDVTDDSKGTYSASMAFSISGLHTKSHLNESKSGASTPKTLAPSPRPSPRKKRGNLSDIISDFVTKVKLGRGKYLEKFNMRQHQVMARHRASRHSFSG